MKRAAVVAVAAVVLLLAIVAWRAFNHTGANSAAFAALIPTGPAPCPDNPGDLAGIEGWAPGAGKAEQAGQSNVGSMSGFAGGTSGESATAAPSAGACSGLRADLVARFDAIAAALKFVPSDGFDATARAQTLADADAIFAFVRDRIQTQAYAGAMRGAAGTLQARAGSPADKAALLAALLAAKQIPVRFVHAPLGQPGTAAAIAAVLAPQPSPEPHDLTDAFKQLGLDAQALHAGAAAVRQRAEAGADGVIAQSAAPTDALLATLKRNNVQLANDDAALRAHWAANLQDHWWVQVQRNGAWVDFDPTLPGAQPGTHAGGAPAGEASDDLPDTVQTTIAVRLVAQRITAGNIAPAVLVERTMKLADVNAAPIVVAIGDRNAGSTGIAAATTFTPSIGGGGGEQNGDPFNADGLAVLTLQIDIAQPGEPLRSYARTVVDRRMAGGKSIDPAWTPQRTAYALTTVYNLLPLAGDLDVGFVSMREGEGMKTVQGFMAYAAAGGNGTQMPPPSSESYPLQALHYFEYDALARRRLEERSGGAVRFFFDRPQLAIEHHALAFDDDKVSGIDQFDVAENGMAATGTQPAAAIRANFTRGYIDEYAEQHLFAAPNDGGTIALMDAAAKTGVPIGVFSGPRYGGTAIAPVKAVTLAGKPRIGWWQIDPQTGNAIGRMDDGAGQELAEYAIARANDWSTLYAMIQFYGDFFRCIAGGVEAPLSGMSGAQSQEWFKQCAGAAICSYLEALGTGEAFSRWSSDEIALLYNILDLSVPGSKDSWPPSGGAVCSGLFHSPLYP